jgi:energy-coupling factor transport system substrate-specific component
MVEMKAKLTIQEIALLGFMTATLSLGKRVLAFIPNVEIVSFLIIIYTLLFGFKVLWAVFAFVLLEIFSYGLGIWTVMYLYIWPLLFFLTLLFRKIRNPIFWSLLSGVFGISFGFFCALPYLFIGGPYMMYAWWLSGLPWDVTHGVANFFICLTLFIPITSLLKKLQSGLSPD